MHAPTPPPSTLVGREREQGALRDRLAGALGGAGSIVLIGGEAGVGKTALAELLCREAVERGALVLVGRCYDLTETPPYGPWVELFGRYEPAEGMAPLPDAFAERGTVGEVGSQGALLQQVLDFLIALAAQRPLVLLLDDLHWADPASLDLLRSLARLIATLPLLLLATYRTEDVTPYHPLSPLLPLLVREAHADRIDLHPLDDAAIRALVAGRYPLPDADSERLVAYLHRRAEGNALFLGELLRWAEETGALRRTAAGWMLEALDPTAVPPLLRQVIEGRLSRLDAEAQRLLAVAAIIGHAVPLALWATIGEVEEDGVVAVAERGLDAHLLTEAGEGEAVRFSHALIREALYERTPAMRRRRIHRRIGEVLAAATAPDPDTVAHHFERAGDPQAFVWLVRAGLRAQRAAAWLTAATRFAAAAALPDEDGARATARWTRRSPWRRRRATGR